MTRQRDFKAVVRARMATTGEKYTVARAAILAQRGQGVDFDGVRREPVAVPERVEFTAGDVVYEEKGEGFGIVAEVRGRSIVVMYESGVRPVELEQLQAVTMKEPRPHRVRVPVPEGPSAVNAALISVGLGELR